MPRPSKVTSGGTRSFDEVADHGGADAVVAHEDVADAVIAVFMFSCASSGRSVVAAGRAGLQHLHFGNVPAGGVEGVDCAGHARIEGVNRAQDFEGVLGAGDGFCRSGPP